MTLHTYSHVDGFIRDNTNTVSTPLEKSTVEYKEVAKDLDKLRKEYEKFLKSFTMTRDEVLIEKSERASGTGKNTADELRQIRAVAYLSSTRGIPAEILHVVKSVNQKGGEYSSYMSMSTFNKAVKYFEERKTK